MNNRDIKKLAHFPSELDAIVNKKFRGAKCTTTFSIFSMSYVTTWNKKLPAPMKRRIKEFVAGFMAGHENLSTKLMQK